MSQKRVSLFERLPEIYRIRDAEQIPPDQLKHFLGLVEEIYGAIHENIESLYHDLFIETCDDWVIPYLGDLLGTTPLKGEPWTLRADVADTIFLRRRKGTIGAIELLTYDLTQWGVHVTELFKNLVWAQHLNHQRPDAGGNPPYADDRLGNQRPLVAQGGTVPLRDPALLALLDSPFDPFAHTPELTRADWGQLRYNLPNLAIFLWRLEAYTVPGSLPLSPKDTDASYIYDYIDPESGVATPLIGVRWHVHPLGNQVQLFNRSQFDPDRTPPVVTCVDEVPGPMHPARLTSASPIGCPEKYVTVDTYDPDNTEFNPLDIGEVGLHLHVPEDSFPEGTEWTFVGSDLTYWNRCLPRPLKKYEVAIDPKLGRIIVPVESEAQRDALLEFLRLTYTYGAVGPVGAHPCARTDIEANVEINLYEDPTRTLQMALDQLSTKSESWVIEIQDSLVHAVDLSGLSDTLSEDGGPNLWLNKSLTIRAAEGQRPMVALKQPLRFRPVQVVTPSADEEEQAELDARMKQLCVRLEGIWLTRGEGFPAGEPLIARAAVHQLELVNCTLDPGGAQQVDGTRDAFLCSLRLTNSFGFQDVGVEAGEYDTFNQIPEILLTQTISGPVQIDNAYSLFLSDSIVDAGQGIEAEMTGADEECAVCSASDSVNGWGPNTKVNGITVFGRMRVERISGKGGIFVHALEVLDNQHGCLKFSYFANEENRLPQTHGCVKGSDARLYFNSDMLDEAAYGQLAQASNYAIREQGPGEDQMGAYGFLQEAHKWRNLGIRFREFMPVGVRPLLVPVT